MFTYNDAIKVARDKAKKAMFPMQEPSHSDAMLWLMNCNYCRELSTLFGDRERWVFLFDAWDINDEEMKSTWYIVIVYRIPDNETCYCFKHITEKSAKKEFYQMIKPQQSYLPHD